MTAEAWSTSWKEQQLEALWDSWSACSACNLADCRTKVVFGFGNPDADIVFVGEAPGEEEDKDGRPFVGRSGQLLNALSAGADLDLDNEYLTNIVACRPPDNRNPIRDEKDACWERLSQILYIIDPLLVVAVGKEALQYLVKGRAWSIEREHGKLFSPGVKIPGRVFPRTDADTKETWNLTYDVVPIFHPAYILRVDYHDEEKDEFSRNGPAEQTVEDLRVIKQRVEWLREEYSRFPKQLNRR